MAAYDDPAFVKALKLLHSTDKDSTIELRNLLEEVIEIKFGTSKKLNLKLHAVAEESSLLLDVPKAKSSRASSPSVIEKSSRSSTPPSEPVSLRTSPDRDDDEDLALQIFEDDLFCTVCKGMRVTSDNRLLECNDCHTLFHQDCHRPPVDSETIDSRPIWSCGECTKKLQEKPSKSKIKTEFESHSDSSSKKHKNDSDGSLTEPPPKKYKTDSDKSESSHRKSEKSHGRKSHGSKSSSSSRSESSKSSKSSSSSNLNFNKAPGSPNGKAPSCTANIIAADRRLQNMKKKAAAKMQEKRSNPK